MDSMEDSGFDSDQKSMLNGSSEPQSTKPSSSKSSSSYSDARTQSHAHRKSSQLQKKLERHRENARKAKVINQQPSKNTFMMPRSRLMIPPKSDSQPRPLDQQPLVAIMTDDESDDDDFESPMLSRGANKDITQQLIKDGYNLDLEPDDEDLDLIPPRPMNERCVCCQNYTGTCAIQ
ncbi:protein FAM219A-like [Pecten maximus]|uniref:protein FAM219A-like n=1 Tax=Pecten maximus TaxID=6579 RepID=UPI00145842DA|nr:protein FAM219A-like [Pecten maximus]